jgi:hypothetical protein
MKGMWIKPLLMIILFFLAMLGFFFLDQDLNSKHKKYATALDQIIAKQRGTQKVTPRPACPPRAPVVNP